MIQTLIKEKKYIGKYVAMEDFNNSAVVAYGNTPQEAYRKARKIGHKTPVITFVPTKKMVHIY